MHEKLHLSACFLGLTQASHYVDGAWSYMVFQTLRDRAILLVSLPVYKLVLLVCTRRQFYSESLDGPVEDVIVFELALIVELTEESSQVCIVGCLIKGEVATVGHVSRHLFRVAQAQGIDWCVDFALLDLLIFVIFIAGTKTLPGKFTL